jgi:hypothetical protein
MGDLVYLPIFKEELQWRRLHEQNQPLQQLDKIIEQIRKLMLKSTQETTKKKKLSRRETIAVVVEQWK